MRNLARAIAAAASGLLLVLAAAGPAQAQDGFVPMADLVAEGALADHWLGDPNAPVTIIEYASVTCPHCKTFHEETLDEFLAKYVDTGVVRFTIRGFLRNDIDYIVMVIAHCSGDSATYYGVLDHLFETQDTWAFSDAPDFETFVALLDLGDFGYSVESIDACLADEALVENVYDVFSQGYEAFGVNATPTFFINGNRYAGAFGFADLQELIEANR